MGKQTETKSSAHELIRLYKLPASIIAKQDFDVRMEEPELLRYEIRQQDNLLFRLARTLSDRNERELIIFTDVSRWSRRTDEPDFERLLRMGFSLNGRHYVMGERSASMTRRNILSFVADDIVKPLSEAAAMGKDVGETVLSKWMAYRGLLLSSCRALEEWMPELIVIPDLKRIIPCQRVRFATDIQAQYTDKDGETRVSTQKHIAEDARDVELNAFDGCGLHHPAITARVRGYLGLKDEPTSILWRAPFIKGVTHEFDYAAFLAERGVTGIRDVWGAEHDASRPMVILTESMYKGMKYFDDWQDYIERFRRYGHCMGIAKWNASMSDEKLFTRANYQILQDLKLSYEDFSALADRSVSWLRDVMSCDPQKPDIYCFLGLYGDRELPQDVYARAVAKNPALLMERGVRRHVSMLLKGAADDMKCGRLWLHASFRFLCPDLVALAEHAGGLLVRGCLEAGQFFTQDRTGVAQGERLLERNPHICQSEHVILHAVNNEALARWCGRLSNVCMVSVKDLTPRRLNGADMDGDLVLVTDEPLMLRGVQRDAAPVIDMEDKATAQAEADTAENRIAVVKRSMRQMVGEISNLATAYHNKTPRTDEQRRKNQEITELLSILNGKAIDYAKTGVLYRVPTYISTYGRPVPYFMKYAGRYYAALKKLSMAHSNMNRLCMDLERWERRQLSAPAPDFDIAMLQDASIPRDEARFAAVGELYKRYNREVAAMKRAKRCGDETDWGGVMEALREKARVACPNVRELANYAVELCCAMYPTRSSGFLWRIAGEGVIENIPSAPIVLPMRDESGNAEYLGEKIRWNLV